MTIEITSRDYQASLALNADDPADLPQIFESISRFVAQVAPGDTFKIQVSLEANRAAVSKGLLEGQASLFKALRLHFGTMDKAAEHFGVSRTTLYNWKGGKGLVSGVHQRHILIEKAPTPETQIMAMELLGLRKAE